MASRFCLRRHGSYSTRKNRFRNCRTPGKGNKVLLLKKKRNSVLCGDKKTKLNGVKKPNFMGLMNLPKRHKKISRVYGGCLSGNAVRKR
jgi:large subunit ribosomal protein L34e